MVLLAVLVAPPSRPSLRRLKRACASCMRFPALARSTRARRQPTTLSALTFGVPSLFGHMPADAGHHRYADRRHHHAVAAGDQSRPGAALTLIVSTTVPLEFTVFQDDVTPLPEGKARITGIHAIAGGPAVRCSWRRPMAARSSLACNTTRPMAARCTYLTWR